MRTEHFTSMRTEQCSISLENLHRLGDVSRGNRIPLKDARALASPAITLASGVPPISPNIPTKPKS